MRIANLFSALGLLGMILISVRTASATLAITEPVDAGSSVTVSGTGSHPNGWVELHVNRVSQGSVKADGSGTFSFSGQQLDAQDELVVTQSRVWNFNTDGDTENWINDNTIPKGTVTAEGGCLIVTKTSPSGDNMTLVTTDTTATPVGLELDPSVYRVWEFRMHNPNQFTNINFRFRGTNAFDNTNLITGALGVRTLQTTDTFETIHLNPDYNVALPAAQTTYQTQTGGDIFQVRLDFNGNSDKVFKFDYIRVSEYYEYDFTDDGDLEYLVPQGVATGTPTVVNGRLNIPFVADNKILLLKASNAAVDKSRLDPGYFTHVAVGGNYTAVDQTTATDQIVFYFDPNGTGLTGNSIAINGMPRNGSQFDLIGDITTKANYQSTPPTHGWRFDIGQNWGRTGDQVSLDYFRLQPANPFGPSPAVTVTGISPSAARHFELYN